MQFAVEIATGFYLLSLTFLPSSVPVFRNDSCFVLNFVRCDARARGFICGQSLQIVDMGVLIAQ